LPSHLAQGSFAFFMVKNEGHREVGGGRREKASLLGLHLLRECGHGINTNPGQEGGGVMGEKGGPMAGKGIKLVSEAFQGREGSLGWGGKKKILSLGFLNQKKGGFFES